MGLRPNVCYRRLSKPYTRTSHRVQKKDFITGIPGSKIHQYEMGKKGGDFDTRIELVARTSGNIRHNTLDAMRVVSSRHLQPIGITNYFFKIPKYPHQILRENPLATGAGADRFQQGMRASFGKPIARAARIKVGETILYVDTSRKFIDAVKDAIRRTSYKTGIACSIRVRPLTGEEKEKMRHQKAKKAKIAEITEEAPKPEEEAAAAEGAAETGEGAEKKEGEEGPREGEKKEEEKGGSKKGGAEDDKKEDKAGDKPKK